MILKEETVYIWSKSKKNVPTNTKKKNSDVHTIWIMTGGAFTIQIPYFFIILLNAIAFFNPISLFEY